MKNIHELEDDLRERWLKSYPDDERKAFCFDGLCYNGEIYNDGKNAHQGNEEKLWNNTDRRILFLMKDTNNNPRCDYREWHWREIYHPFFNCIFKWLKGLSRISKDFIPTMENGDYATVPNAVVTKYPLAIVNIKKISGTSSISNKTLYEYANRDKAFLQEQIRDILHPNIIVCGGGKGTVLNIAKNIIYEDESFREINYFCHYSRKLNILLIDSFHPSARINSYWKIEDMMLKVHEFILETDPPFMK